MKSHLAHVAYEDAVEVILTPALVTAAVFEFLLLIVHAEATLWRMCSFRAQASRPSLLP